MLLSVVIPVFNEQSTIEEVITRVAAVELPIEKEIIVVDDSSTDGTVEVLRVVSDKIAHTHLSQANAGKGSAVRIGLGLAKGDIVLIQDADLEYDPNDFRVLIEPILSQKASAVYGSRFITTSSITRMRRFANYIFTTLFNLLFRGHLTDMCTCYKVLTRSVAESLDLKSDGFEIEAEITAQLAVRGVEIIEVPVSYAARTKMEGKKIKWHHGFRIIGTMIKYRLAGLPRPLGEKSPPIDRSAPIDGAHPQTSRTSLDR